MKKSIVFFLFVNLFFSILSFSQYQLSEEQIIKGYNFLQEKGGFKNPSSLKYNSHTISKKQFTRECFTWVKYDVSAQNGFGGFVRSDFIVYFFDGQPIYIESENGPYFMWANNDAVPDKIIPLAKLNGIVVGECSIDIERQKEKQRIEEVNRKKNEQKKIDELYKSIANKEYYKSYISYLSLNSELKRYFNEKEIFEKWDNQKSEIDSLYSIYKREFATKKNEYIQDYFKFLNENSSYLIDTKIRVLENAFNETEQNSNNLGGYNSKTSNNFFVYSFFESQHLITPVGVYSNIYMDTSILNYCQIQLQVSFDSLKNNYYSKLNFKSRKNGELVFSGYIVNSNDFSIQKYLMPYPNRLESIIKKINNELPNNFIEKNYPQLFLNIDYFNILPADNFKTVAYPGVKLKNADYEFNKNKFNPHIDIVNKYVGKKIIDKTPNFYNPMTLYFFKKLYPNSDSLIFVINSREEFREDLGSLALHLNVRETPNSSITPYGSIIPLQKNVIELKNNKLLLYNGQGNYKEISINVFPGSLYKLSDFNIQYLNQEDEIFLEKEFYNCPFYVEELQIGKSDPKSFIFNIDNKVYYHSNSVFIQRLPIYSTEGSISPSSISFSINDGERSYNSFMNEYQTKIISMEGYLKNMLKYYQFLQTGNTYKANKYLLKADKSIIVFDNKYKKIRRSKAY